MQTIVEFDAGRWENRTLMMRIGPDYTLLSEPNMGKERLELTAGDIVDCITHDAHASKGETADYISVLVPFSLAGEVYRFVVSAKEVWTGQVEFYEYPRVGGRDEEQ